MVISFEIYEYEVWSSMLHMHMYIYTHIQCTNYKQKILEQVHKYIYHDRR